MPDPLQKEKKDFSDIIKKIESDSSVGIDAQLTHAFIIDYLQNIQRKLESIEEYIRSKEEGRPK